MRIIEGRLRIVATGSVGGKAGDRSIPTGCCSSGESRLAGVLGPVCAVIVTYHPDLELLSRMARVARQVDRAAVVDNTAEESSEHRLRGFAEALGSDLILNSRNVGIARALNQGAKCAGEHGCAWMLT
jgi:hypothetical protein